MKASRAAAMQAQAIETLATRLAAIEEKLAHSPIEAELREAEPLMTFAQADDIRSRLERIEALLVTRSQPSQPTRKH